MFKTIPVKNKGSCVGICMGVVFAVIRDALCDCIYISSRKTENRSVCLSLVGLSSASKSTLAWLLRPRITLVFACYVLNVIGEK